MKEIIIECAACHGTGLYKGAAERGQAAVVCYRCDGTGMTKFTYTDFTGRKKRSDVRRVYDGSHGYIITDEDVKTDKGELIRFSKAGCTYAEWLAGKKPEPIRELYCPYLWRNEGIGNEPLQRCKRHCRGFGSITSCEVYGDKQTCWEIYDAMRQEVSP